jgi:hypothetical protein
MRKFTLNEVTRLTGLLKLYALPFFCEICDDKKKAQAEMALVTATGVPICTCLLCASKLIAFSAKRQHGIEVDGKRMQPKNGAVAPKKRGRPRKVAQ